MRQNSMGILSLVEVEAATLQGFNTVCTYHATYAFQSESTIYSCLNVKELLA